MMNECEVNNNISTKEEFINSKNISEKYLLILPCSKRKKNLPMAEAIELYDGPFYQIFRKHKRANIDVLILSAKYGLIEGTDIILPYDLRMTPEIARNKKKDVQCKLKHHLESNKYHKVLINLGKSYRIVIEDCDFQVDHNLSPEFLEGPIGIRNSGLKKWLMEIKE